MTPPKSDTQKPAKAKKSSAKASSGKSTVKKKRTGGGKAPNAGVPFQAKVAAWIACHALAKKPLRHVFGGLITAVPASIRHELEAAAPVTISELRSALKAIPNSLQGARNKALLSIGFAGALRCSELVSLDFSKPTRDGKGIVAIEPDEMRITLFRSKTDQEGRGHTKVIPRGGSPCPVEALEAWINTSGIRGGAIFRVMTKHETILDRRLSSGSVSGIVKRSVYAAAIANGLSEEQAAMKTLNISSHSLRVGFVTSAAAANISSERIARHVGWTSTQMTVHYVRQHISGKTSPALEVLRSSD